MKELDGEEGDKPEKKEKKGGKGGDKFIQKGKGEKEEDTELDLDDLDLDDLEGEMMDRLMKELDGEEGDKPEKKGSKGGDKFIQKGKGEKEMDGEMDLDLDDLDLDDLEGEMMDRLMKELDGE